MNTQEEILIPSELRFVLPQVIKKLSLQGWNAIVEDDPDFGIILLADPKAAPLSVLRRIKLFLLKNAEDKKRANDLQKKLRGQLVEIHPYKIFYNKRGNRKLQLLPALFTIG